MWFDPRIVHLADFFRCTGLRMNNEPTEASIHEQNRRFRKSFGMNWFHCAITWDLIYPDLLQNHGKSVKKEHLLWCLLFFKKYSKNKTDARTAGTMYKTFSKWVWIITIALADCENEMVSTFLFYIFNLRTK